MARPTVIALVLVASACGPQVGDVPGDDAGSTSLGDSSTSGASSTTAPPGDSTGPEPATTEPVTTEPPADASTSSGSTGEPWTEVAEQTYADARCIQEEPVAWIELFPDEEDGSCAASPETENVIVIAVQPWDGIGGTFAVGPDGPAFASATADLQELTGEVTIEVSAPWTLEAVTYDLVGDDLMLSGAAELGGCVDVETGSPCD